MGVLSKLKGIFYDEVIVEEPEEEIKKVDKIVKKEVVVEEPVEEVKPKFDAFEEMKEAKEEKENGKKIRSNKLNLSIIATPKEEKKQTPATAKNENKKSITDIMQNSGIKNQ